jgi:endo-1,4-beta-xylanase
MSRYEYSLFWLMVGLGVTLLALGLVIATGALYGGLVTVTLNLPGLTQPEPTITAGAAPVHGGLTPQESGLPAPTPTSLPNSLSEFAENHGVLIGTAVTSGYLYDPQYTSLLTHQFNAITPENEMKFEFIHPEEGRYDFSAGDAIVDFARKNGLKVRGHTLVWGNQLPKWVLEANYSRDEWIGILQDHIYTVVGHFRGADNDHTVVAWDVVNEAISDQGGLFDNFWLQKIGPEYIALAFRFAHEADPDALLFYNDNGGEGLNPKSQGIYNLVQGLVQSGVPINGVGLQMHTALGSTPSSEDIQANMKRLGELGLLVNITEMDVRTQYSDLGLAEKLQQQAQVYRQAMTACLQSPNCKGFYTWGLTDRFSWIPAFTGHADYPLLFDENYQPKPAYDAVLDALR